MNARGSQHEEDKNGEEGEENRPGSRLGHFRHQSARIVGGRPGSGRDVCRQADSQRPADAVAQGGRRRVGDKVFAVQGAPERLVQAVSAAGSSA